MSLRRLRDSLVPRALGPAVPEAIVRGPARDETGRPLLYLTVDDGPDAEGTPLWIDALARNGAGAVGFFSAGRAEAHPDLIRRWIAAGHRVGNHGDRHVSAWRTSPSVVRAEMERAERVLRTLTGAPVSDLRPPYGRVTPGLVRWCATGRRRLVLWDLLPGDYLPSRTPDQLAEEIVTLARPGSILVLHDGPPARRAVAALDLALPRLRAAGWRFPVLPTAP